MALGNVKYVRPGGGVPPSLADRLAARYAGTQAFNEQSPAGEDTPATLMAAEVQQGMAPGLVGNVPPPLPHEQLQEGFTSDDLAQATGSPWAANARYRPEIEMDSLGNAVYDDQGGVKERPIDPDRWRAAKAEAVSATPNFEQAVADGVSPTDMAKQVLSQAAAYDARYRGPETGPEIKRAADNLGNIIALITTDAENNLFNPYQTKVWVSDANGDQVPAGAQALEDTGLSDEYHSPIATLMGVGYAVAVSQAPVYRKENEATPEDLSGNRLVDAQPLINIIGAGSAAAKAAMDRTPFGERVSMEAVQAMMAAQVQSEIQAGRLIATKDKSGRIVYSPIESVKSRARDLKFIREALAGDTQRAGLSSVPTGLGSSMQYPGSKTTSKDIRNDELVTLAADITKDIWGSILFKYHEKDVRFKQVQLDDIVANMETDPETGLPIFSTGIYAKGAKVSEADYKARLNELKPWEGYDPKDPVQKAKWEQRKRKHASSVIEDKLKSMAYAVEAGQNQINKPGYKSFISSAVNGRFYENTRGADTMADKWGAREMLNFAKQDAVRGMDMFDTDRIAILKSKGAEFLKLVGVARQRAMKLMPPGELAAIGTMINIVLNYMTAVDGKSTAGILKMGEAKVLEMYTPEMANALATLGKEYNEYLADPLADTHDNIKRYLAAMPRGEALGNKNLWDDAFNLRNNAKSMNHIPLTHINFDDGNQNGIFLQALFFGDASVARRLGIADPSMGDMRDHALNVILQNLEKTFAGKPEHVEAWTRFLAAGASEEKFAADLFKIPLMQNGYGKDAGMFGAHVDSFLMDSDYRDAAIEHLITNGPYTGMEEASTALNNAVEASLREVVSQNDGNVMTSAGRLFGILMHIPLIKNINGDTMALGPSSLLPILDPSKDTHTAFSGEVKLGVEAHQFQDATGADYPEIPKAMRQADPAASKGRIGYFNPKTEEWSYFDNYKGTSASRMFLVMPIQGADGGLATLATMAVNDNRSSPTPVSFVHDAVNSTASGALIYRNAYNNIAIPEAIKEIGRFGEKVRAEVNRAESLAKEKADKLGRVGIYDEGQFPAMGAYFDEMFEKATPGGDYQRYKYLKAGYDPSAEIRNPTPDQMLNKVRALEWWKGYKEKKDDILNRARSAGWKPKGSVPETNRSKQVVTPDQFKTLIRLAKQGLNMSGLSNTFDSWVNNFQTKVEHMQRLVATEAAKSGGFWQMTPSGGKRAKSVEEFAKAKAAAVPKMKTGIDDVPDWMQGLESPF